MGRKNDEKSNRFGKKGVPDRKFSGRKERRGRGGELENEKEICADHPHQAISAPRPGDGLVVSLDKTHLVSSRSGSGCPVIGGKTEKKVIPHQGLMRVGALRAFRHTRTYIIAFYVLILERQRKPLFLVFK